MPFWLTALCGFFFVARGTRFLNSDYLAKDFRAWVLRRFGDGRLYYLITCPWCASIWIGLITATVAVVTLSPYTGWPAMFLILGLTAGYSYVYGLLAINLDDE